MNYKVKFSYAIGQGKTTSNFDRIGTEIYRHPKNRFVTLEFQGKGGKFRESFYVNELEKV